MVGAVAFILVRAKCWLRLLISPFLRKKRPLLF